MSFKSWLLIVAVTFLGLATVLAFGGNEHKTGASLFTLIGCISVFIAACVPTRKSS